MSDPLLTIVIPTKDRYEYLRIVVDMLLSFSDKRLELVVQDNSTDNSVFRDYVQSADDSRLIYNHCPEWLSVCENCDRGIDLASGQFICMLGDDDGATESILSVAIWMRENGIDAVLPRKPIYLWPGVKGKMVGELNRGSLIVSRFGGCAQAVNVDSELESVIAAGGTKLNRLPRVYHGIVSKRCLDFVKVETGSYFPGPSPDMANAVGLSKYVKRFYTLDYPVTISGQSTKSTGAQGLRKEHIGKIEEQEHLPARTADNWSSLVPKFWSGSTIWAESAVQALVATEQTILLQKLNYPYLYASCKIFEPEQKRLVQESIRLYCQVSGKSPLVIRIAMCWPYIRIWSDRVTSFATNLVNRIGRYVHLGNRVDGLDTIGEAVKYLENRYSSLSAPWK